MHRFERVKVATVTEGIVRSSSYMENISVNLQLTSRFNSQNKQIYGQMCSYSIKNTSHKVHLVVHLIAGFDRLFVLTVESTKSAKVTSINLSQNGISVFRIFTG